jgi:hypothetical protein
MTKQPIEIRITLSQLEELIKTTKRLRKKYKGTTVIHDMYSIFDKNLNQTLVRLVIKPDRETI